MPEPAHFIRIARVPVERIIDLRHAVLRAGLPRETAHFLGDSESTTVHLAAMKGEKVIGCATVLRGSFEGRPAAHLRGMAVDPAWQRRGIGERLLVEVTAVAKEMGMTMIWANCRVPAVPFYRKQGWVAVSDEFVIETAGPHIRMTCAI